MVFENNSYVLPLVFIALESLGLAYLIWRRGRGNRGVIPFILMMSALAFWSLAYAVELSVVTLEAKYLLTKIDFIGIISVPLTAFLFCADYTGVDRWLTRKNVALLLIIPVITLVMVWSNDLHHLFYSRIFMNTDGPIPEFKGVYGPWFWVHATYSYLLMLFGLGMLLRALTRSPEFYRGQAATLLAGMLAPWIGNAIHIAGLSPFPALDITPFFFAFSGLMFAISMTRYRLLDIVPAARDMVLENMRDAVIVLDLQERVVDLNPAARAILGAAAEGAIGKPLVEVIPNRREIIERFRDFPEVRTELDLTIGSEPRTLDLRVSTLRSRGGNPTGRLIVLHDITEAKGVERKLAEARDQAVQNLRLRSRIVAVVSHELRTPLGAIVGYADMLREDVHGPLTDAQRAVVGRIMTNANQLTDLVNDLLDEARIEQGKVTIHIGPFEPGKLLEGIEASMGSKARAKGIRLVTEIAPGAPEVVRSDLGRLTQVVSNLVANALKFTEAGEVKVRLFKADEQQWALSVADTGPGIVPEDQKHIFDPFWQADNSDTREHKGVGLGLSIAKQLTHLLGGQIKVESQVGKGTTFTVLFPWSSVKEKVVEKIPGAGS